MPIVQQHLANRRTCVAVEIIVGSSVLVPYIDRDDLVRAFHDVIVVFVLPRGCYAVLDCRRPPGVGARPELGHAVDVGNVGLFESFSFFRLEAPRLDDLHPDPARLVHQLDAAGVAAGIQLGGRSVGKCLDLAGFDAADADAIGAAGFRKPVLHQGGPDARKGYRKGQLGLRVVSDLSLVAQRPVLAGRDLAVVDDEPAQQPGLRFRRILLEELHRKALLVPVGVPLLHKARLEGETKGRLVLRIQRIRYRHRRPDLVGTGTGPRRELDKGVGLLGLAKGQIGGVRNQNRRQPHHNPGAVLRFLLLSFLRRQAVGRDAPAAPLRVEHARQVPRRKGEFFDRDRQVLLRRLVVLALAGGQLEELQLVHSVAVRLQQRLSDRHKSVAQPVVRIQRPGVAVPDLDLQNLVPSAAKEKVDEFHLRIPDGIAIVLDDARLEEFLGTQPHLDVDVGNVVGTEDRGGLLDLEAPSRVQPDADQSLVGGAENVPVVDLVDQGCNGAVWQDQRLGQRVSDDAPDGPLDVDDAHPADLDVHVGQVGQSREIELDLGRVDKGKLYRIHAGQGRAERLGNDLEPAG
mmetsp:Transcript_24192/g.53848  ORF Transcript_24192/g.53848 Transcript_24192/m.53848 type:complete len:574 (-) Transcript_24192:331-2052(-)